MDPLEQSEMLDILNDSDQISTIKTITVCLLGNQKINDFLLDVTIRRYDRHCYRCNNDDNYNGNDNNNNNSENRHRTLVANKTYSFMLMGR